MKADQVYRELSNLLRDAKKFTRRVAVDSVKIGALLVAVKNVNSHKQNKADVVRHTSRKGTKK